MTRRVACVYPFVPWVVRCIEGVRRYAHEQGCWRLFSGPGDSFKELRGWNGDGIITLMDRERELSDARKAGIPMVNLGGLLPKSFGIPRVMVNHFKGGQLAADHLLSRGLRDLAVFGWKNAWYADQRRLGFTERAAEAGVTCHVLLRPYRDAARTLVQRITDTASWLGTLPRPCGVFAVHDYRTQVLLEACAEAGLRIPEDIALIGMDNDENICKHTSPTLTSVARNSERVGWEAAALLDRLMQGEPPPIADLLVEPRKVIARQSTDMLYCSDPMVKSALDYMRENLKAQFNISAIAERAGVSKRTLELRFRESLGSSPHENLTKLRVEHAQALMQMPQKLKITQIAAECGFGTTQTFYAAFERVTGESALSFRKKHATTDPG